MSKFLDSNGLQYFWQKIKNAIRQCLITDSASGAIASFSDGAAMPMESLTVGLEPIQDLHGYDSPWPAGGGKNMFNPDVVANGYISDTSGAFILQQTSRASDYIAVLPDTSYYIANSANSGRWGAWYDENKTYISACNGVGVKTSPSNARYIRITVSHLNNNQDFANNVIVAKSSSAVPWSPYSNICPITGRESVTVVRTGKNLLEATEYKGAYNETAVGKDLKVGTASDSEFNQNGLTVNVETSWTGVLLATCTLDAGTYFVHVGAFASPGRVSVYTTDKDLNMMKRHYNSTGSARNGAVTVSDGERIAVFAGASNAGSVMFPEMQCEYNTAFSAYAPPNIAHITLPLGQTVYGGTVNVTGGSKTESKQNFTFDGTEAWTIAATGTNRVFRLTNAFPPLLKSANVNTYIANWAVKTIVINNVENSGIDYWAFRTTAATVNVQLLVVTPTANVGMTLTEFKAMLAANPLQIVADLSVPVESSIDPATLSTLKGTNNVWSDADSVTVDYVADPKLYIARLTEPDADMVADAKITSGSYFMVGNNLYLATSNIASGATIVPGVNCTKTNLSAALNAHNAINYTNADNTLYGGS